MEMRQLASAEEDSDHVLFEVVAFLGLGVRRGLDIGGLRRFAQVGVGLLLDEFPEDLRRDQPEDAQRFGVAVPVLDAVAAQLQAHLDAVAQHSDLADAYAVVRPLQL